MIEEKKITLDDLEELLEDDATGVGRSRLNFQTIFTALVLNWHWFLLSLIIFVCGALIYLRYSEPVYQVSSRMLIKDQNRYRRNSSQMLASVEDLGFLNNSSGIDNEVEVLKSRILLRDVVKDLKLYTEYRREGRIHDVICYKTHPFNIDLDPVHLDSLDLVLLEKPQSLKMRLWREGQYYMISGTVNEAGKEPVPFARRAKSLPATFKTSLGTVTMTRVPDKEFKEDTAKLQTMRAKTEQEAKKIGAVDYLCTVSLNGTDVGIIRGKFGVAENACVWIPQQMKEKAVCFISENLIILFKRIEFDETYDGYGTFISGPSKTADIAQVLVMGAQAARSATILLLPE